MGSVEWEIANLANNDGLLGRPVADAGIWVPNRIELDRTHTELMYGHDSKRVYPESYLLNHFVKLWKQPSEKVLLFARKWGVLGCDETGRPCNAKWSEWIFGNEEWHESLQAWRHFSLRAHAILNIIAKLQRNAVGDLEDWRNLCDLQSHLGDLQKELDQHEAAYIWAYSGKNYPLFAFLRDPDRNIERERTFLAAEVSIWLRIGRTKFTIIPKRESGWELLIDHEGNLFSYLALQLALVLCGHGSMFICSGCSYPYVREKGTKAPKRGQSNFCPECGRPAALKQADRLRRERAKEARRLAAEGMSIDEISKAINTKPATVSRWTRKMKADR